MTAVAWISHPACLEHGMGPGHPECPERLQAIEERLDAAGLFERMWRVEAPAASRGQLERVHAPAHVQRVLGADTTGGPVWHDPDTSQGPLTAEAALRAAGAGVRAVDLALGGEAGLAFCAVRPPGHHAESGRAMGFCFFNNVAVAAAHALAAGLERVAVLDFDVHYGNGTAQIFAGDPRVTLYNTYQDPLYPYWDGIAGAANLVDVPLRAGSRGAVFREAVSTRWLPGLRAQRPQMIFVSAGFDAHDEDPLAGLRLDDSDYAWMAQQVRDLATECSGGRVVAMLEGGYALGALGRSVEAFLGPWLQKDGA